MTYGVTMLLANTVKIMPLIKLWGGWAIKHASQPLPSASALEAPKVHCLFTFKLAILEESAVNETLWAVTFKTTGNISEKKQVTEGWQVLLKVLLACVHYCEWKMHLEICCIIQ